MRKNTQKKRHLRINHRTSQFLIHDTKGTHQRHRVEMSRFQLELGLLIIGHIDLQSDDTLGLVITGVYGLRSAVDRLLSGGFPGEECSA